MNTKNTRNSMKSMITMNTTIITSSEAPPYLILCHLIKKKKKCTVSKR